MLTLKQHYPWRSDTIAKLLIDGVEFYPAMLKAVAGARSSVLLEMYLFESGAVGTRFIDALLTARDNGARVLLILDDFGCRKLETDDRTRLLNAGVEIHFYNPFRYGRLRRSLFRDHRKLLVVDGEVAYIGGAGLTDDFDHPEHPQVSWRETMVEIRGLCVHDWQSLFVQTWQQHRSLLLSLPAPAPATRQGIPGRVACSSGQGAQDHKRSLLKRLRTAERTIWIATGYFLPSRKIRRALTKAAGNDIDVRLLLPGKHTDHPAVRHAGRRFYHTLLKHGVRLFEYQPRFTHSKVIVADNWVSIGSSNIDRWNLRWNLEANQELEGDQFAAQVRAMFENDFRESQEITLHDWQRRSQYRRFLEWFWGRIDILLDKATRR